MKYTITYLAVLVMACCTLLSFRSSRGPVRKLNKIAKEYKKYWVYRERTAIKDTAKYMKWAVALCSRPCYCIEHSSFVSNADVSLSPHGNKLYRLYIKDRESYLKNAPGGQPIGQILVKETWNVRGVVYDSTNDGRLQTQNKNDGKWYVPTTVSELFIMYKEEEREGNDKGWSYGTVSIEDKSKETLLLNDIKISSCISCHKDTKYDRIFGGK